MRALIAGQGALPGLLAGAIGDAVVCEMEGFPSGLPDPLLFRVETLGTLIETLRTRGVTEVCFAGAVRRPPLDPAAVDGATMPLVPRMLAALQQGDDAALQTVIAFFEEAGMAVVGAEALMPELLPAPGVLTQARPGERDRADARRAETIHAALAGVDVGQGCVVAAGQALAVESFGGTDWMLDSLAGPRRPKGPAGGLLFKAPKPQQDRRIDLPVAADAAGLFLWVRET